MFDDTEFMNSSTLEKVWRASYQQTETDTDDVNLPKICNFVNQYIESSELQSSKVPLKTSSVLIDGAAKLYKAEVNSLLRKCYELDMEMSMRKTRMVKLDIRSYEDCNDLNISLERSLLSICNQDHCDEYSESNSIYGSSASNRKRRQSTPNNSHREKRRRSASSINEMDQNIRNILDQDYDDRIDRTLTEFNLSTFEKNGDTMDKGIQTNNSYINRLQGNINTSSINQSSSELPFGFVMIFDSCNDQFPSKIIYSSFNSSVKNL